jgi:hypothetical protein
VFGRDLPTTALDPPSKWSVNAFKDTCDSNAGNAVERGSSHLIKGASSHIIDMV